MSRALKTLVIDVGGTNVKVLATGRRTPIKISSGSDMTPDTMVAAVLEAVSDWEFDRVSIGYPGPVRDNRPSKDPWNLGPGWTEFDFAKAFGKPVRAINDAAMQALGSYEGGVMLFLGLGTGVGAALILDGTVVPMELAHLPYRRGKTYEEYIGAKGYERLGKRRWRKHVGIITEFFQAAFVADYVVLGGGNAQRMKALPPNARLGNNANAFKGGFRLWDSRA
jgi:predicted NBD/HSP70 family sugar kinase